jgi:hypothetical protein
MRLSSLLRSSPGHIRSRLFRDLMLLVLLTVGLLVLVNWLLIDKLKREHASARIATATALVRKEVQTLVGPVTQQLLIARDDLRAVGLTPKDRDALNERFRPVMRHVDQIAGVIFADGSGAEYFLRRDNGEWVARERPPGKASTATWTRWSIQHKELATRSQALDYDPRVRPWFIDATETRGKRVTWSAPYIFHSLQVPGITASVAWEKDGITRVLGMDVVLSRIVAALEELPLGPGGRGFLVSDEGGVYVPSPGNNTSAESSSRFFSASEKLGGPLIFDAVAAWEAKGHPAEGAIRFSSEGRDWWTGFLPISSDPDSAWVGVVLPASETFGVLQSRWQMLAATAFAILAVAVALVALLMRKYSRKLRDLPKLSIDRSSYAQDILDLIRNGEDMHLELKSTMRTNLHTGKPGKEIELAWLKGATAFLNTEGGILLLGIADDGSLVGLEADKFENDDKCRLHFKNLLNQHLGAENARLVRFDIYELEGKRIGAVECERSDAPVYLRTKNEESFLIRNGPSNIELSISRALKYIRGRF